MALQVRLLQGAMVVLVGALGFIAGRETAPSQDEAVLTELGRLRATVEARDAQPLPPPEVRCAVASSAAAPVDLARFRAEVAQVLREELGSRNDGAARPESQPPPSPSTPLPQAVAAREGGMRLIDDAIQTRQWREQDASAMRQLLMQMTDAQRKEVRRRLIVTLNAGGINMRLRGSPF